MCGCMEGLKIIFIDLHATRNISDTSTRDIFLSLSRAYIVLIVVAHSCCCAQTHYKLSVEMGSLWVIKLKWENWLIVDELSDIPYLTTTWPGAIFKSSFSRNNFLGVIVILWLKMDIQTRLMRKFIEMKSFMGATFNGTFLDRDPTSKNI